MSQLEDLLQTLCPYGVEKFKLSTVSEIKRGQRITKSELIPEGLYPVVSGGINPMGFTNNYNRNENTITVAQYGTAGFVNWQTNKFWANDVCYSIYPDQKLLNRYLCYYLLTTQDFIYTLVIDAVPAHLPQSRLASIEIPIPPLPVQEEIVRILDTFSNTVAELEAERAARIRQYEHYRDFLLTFNETAGQLLTDKQVRWVTLGEIATKISTGGTPNTQNSSFYDGTIPWLRTQEVNWLDIYDTGIKITDEGFNDSSANWIPMNCVIVAMYGATAAKVAINKISLTTNQACCNIQVDETKALYRYVFYWLCKEYETLRAKGQGSQSNINSLIVKNHPIPLPSLEEQSRIVEILDRFDTLVNDLKTGLPAEIALRRKQYEHYRDTLLTFTQTN